jgi:DnaK suppressor protein
MADQREKSPVTLTPDQIAELQEELQRELARLERGMEQREDTKPVELDQTSVGRLSRIDALQNQQIAAGLRGREVARHGELLAALERIERGTYGRCERCGGTIPYGRLLVIPEARACAGCG